MFYTYAEKQGNIFFDGWKMRVVAFDSMRRYLYYTSNPLEPQQIVPPNVPPCPPVPAPTDTNTNTTPNTPAMPTIASNHSITTPEPGPVSRFPHTNSAANLSSVSPFHTSPEEYNVPAPEPCRPSDLTWSKKIKVDLIIPVAREHLFLREDSHLKEQDYYQVEIHGEYRTLQNGECPAPGPFLCPSGGLGGIPSRCCLHNEEYIRDPFFLRELYDSLRDQFTSLRQERERQALATGVAYNEDKNKTQTLRSPRGRGSRVRLVMRLRSEHEFRRFWFVVQSVLGYDKIIARPYRGLPPYDPRNGITFSLVPMYLYNTFKELEKTVIYTFLRVDVVGRSTAGELSVFLHGSFLCITHDTILLLRETGNIPRWVKLQQVKEFHYNYTCRRPYIAFISDPGAPDLVLIPQPPGYGAEAIECFDAALETLRIRHVVRDACLASLDIRRVIAIHASPAASVRRFVEGYEAQIGRHLNFDPAAGYRGVLSCPLPKEQLANVWREVQGVYAARDLSVVSRSAIPLYSNNTNEVPLTPAQLSALSWRLSRERASSDDIVGMSFGEVQHLDEAVEAYERRQQHHHHPHHHHHHHRHNSHHHEHSQSLPSMGTATIPQPAFSATEYGGENSERHAESSTSRERSTFDGRPPISPTPSTPQSPYGIQSLTQDQLNEHIHAEQLQTPQLHSHPTPAVLARRTGEDVGQDVMAPEEVDGACSSVCSSCSSTSSSREGYQVPGSRYLTKEEVSSGAAAALEVVEDQHAVMMSQTPLAANSTQQFLQAVAETHIDDLVQHSMTAMHRKGSGALASANSGTASNSSPQNSVGRRVSKHGPLHPPTTPGRRATTTTTTKTNNNNSNTTHKLDT